VKSWRRRNLFKGWKLQSKEKRGNALIGRICSAAHGGKESGKGGKGIWDQGGRKIMRSTTTRNRPMPMEESHGRKGEKEAEQTWAEGGGNLARFCPEKKRDFSARGVWTQRVNAARKNKAQSAIR